jgi:hypothetical protein
MSHVLSVEVLAGLPPIRQRLSFLDERFLVSALVKLGQLQEPTAIYTDGSKIEGLVGFGIFLDTVLDCLGNVVFTKLKCALFILPAT